MSAKRWSPSITSRFVDEYAKHRCLWDSHSEDYKNRVARDAAINNITRNMDLPDLHPNDVKCKIRIIRNTYINEMKKMMSKKKRVDGRTYVCHIPWFKTADKFLKNVVRINVPKITMEEAENECEKPDDHPDKTGHGGYPPFQAYLENDIKTEQNDDEHELEIDWTDECEQMPSARASASDGSRFGSPQGSTSDSVVRGWTESDDEFDVFSRSVAMQLKKLPLANALAMEAKIHDMLIQERLKVLNNT